MKKKRSNKTLKFLSTQLEVIQQAQEIKGGLSNGIGRGHRPPIKNGSKHNT